MGINWNRCKPSSPMSTHSSARTGLFQKFLIAEPTLRTISRPSITAWEQRHCFSKRTSKSFRSHPMEIGWNLKSEKGVAWWQHPSELHSCGALGGTRTPNLLIRSQMLYPIELRAQQGDSTARLDRGEIRRLVPSRSGGRVMKLEHPEPFVCRWHAKWMWNTRPALQLDTATRMVLADATDKVAMFRRELELDAVPASARAWPPLKSRAMSKERDRNLAIGAGISRFERIRPMVTPRKKKRIAGSVRFFRMSASIGLPQRNRSAICFLNTNTGNRLPLMFPGGVHRRFSWS